MTSIIIFSIVLLGMIVFVMSMIYVDTRLGIISVVMITLPSLFWYFRGRKTEKSVLIFPEEKYESILSSYKPLVKKKNIIRIIITIFIASIVLGFSWMWLKNSFSSPSPLSLGGVINSACIELDPRTGCRNDPSKIIVNYDVNRDGKRDGVNDTLSELLAKYNCTGDCIKRRCGCPGY